MTRRTCPVEMLVELHKAATAGLDASKRDDDGSLVSRLGAIQDTILAHEALSPSGLRLQAAVIRTVMDGVDHGEHMNAVARLAAAYADRLATLPTAPPPPSPDRPSFVNLCDTAVHLLDALGAVYMAIEGVDDEAQIRSLRFLVEKTQDIASEISEMTLRLHAGTPDDGDDRRDANLRNTITAWHVVEERIAETDGTPEHQQHVDRSHRLLAKIAETEAHTMRGALAKTRICFDDDEIERLMQDGAPIESVGASGMRDLFRITGRA